MRQTALVSV